EGALVAEGGGERAAALGPGALRARAADGEAWVYRVELVRQPPPPAGGRVLLEHPIDLAGGAGWLMRCDRVDFDPGGVAPPHRHRGGGIRCLLQGRLEVTVGEGSPRAVAPGGAWFESGREPVVVDHFRELVHPVFDRASGAIYYWLLRRAPSLWALGYTLGDRLGPDSPL